MSTERLISSEQRSSLILLRDVAAATLKRRSTPTDTATKELYEASSNAHAQMWSRALTEIDLYKTINYLFAARAIAKVWNGGPAEDSGILLLGGNPYFKNKD